MYIYNIFSIKFFKHSTDLGYYSFDSFIYEYIYILQVELQILIVKINMINNKIILLE